MNDQDILKDLAQYDRDFRPAENFNSLPTTEELPEAVYVGTFTNGGEFDKRRDNGSPLLKINFITTIPGVGEAVVRHTWFLDQGGDRLGASLKALDFDTDQWTPANRRPFSQELLKLVRSGALKGLRFQAKRRNYVSKGKEGWSFDFSARLKAPAGPQGGSGSVRPAPAPLPPSSSRQPVHAGQPEGGDIPF